MRNQILEIMTNCLEGMDKDIENHFSQVKRKKFILF